MMLFFKFCLVLFALIVLSRLAFAFFKVKKQSGHLSKLITHLDIMNAESTIYDFLTSDYKRKWDKFRKRPTTYAAFLKEMDDGKHRYFRDNFLSKEFNGMTIRYVKDEESLIKYIDSVVKHVNNRTEKEVYENLLRKYDSDLYVKVTQPYKSRLGSYE